MNVCSIEFDGMLQMVAALSNEEMLDANPEHFALADESDTRYGAEVLGV